MGPEASIVIQPLIQAMSFGLGAKEMATGQYWIHPALPEVVENALLGLRLRGGAPSAAGQFQASARTAATVTPPVDLRLSLPAALIRRTRAGGSNGTAGGSWPRIAATRAVMSAMIAAVAPSRAVRVRGPVTQRDRSTGGPATTCTVLRGNGRGRPSGGSRSCVPQFATGMTGTPVTSARRPIPFFAFIGQPSGSAVKVPSG